MELSRSDHPIPSKPQAARLSQVDWQILSNCNTSCLHLVPLAAGTTERAAILRSERAAWQEGEEEEEVQSMNQHPRLKRKRMYLCGGTEATHISKPHAQMSEMGRTN